MEARFSNPVSLSGHRYQSNTKFPDGSHILQSRQARQGIIGINRKASPDGSNHIQAIQVYNIIPVIINTRQ